MENKTEYISLISLILGIIFFVLPSPYWLISILFFSIGLIVPLIKQIWITSGWISEKIERIK